MKINFVNIEQLSSELLGFIAAHFLKYHDVAEDLMYRIKNVNSNKLPSGVILNELELMKNGSIVIKGSFYNDNLRSDYVYNCNFLYKTSNLTLGSYDIETDSDEYIKSRYRSLTMLYSS